MYKLSKVIKRPHQCSSMTMIVAHNNLPDAQEVNVVDIRSIAVIHKENMTPFEEEELVVLFQKSE